MIVLSNDQLYAGLLPDQSTTDVAKLLDGVAQGVVSVAAWEATGFNTVQAVVVGSGSVSGTMDVLGSLNGVDYDVIATVTVAAGTTRATKVIAVPLPVSFIKLRATTVTGVGATMFGYAQANHPGA